MGGTGGVYAVMLECSRLTMLVIVFVVVSGQYTSKNILLYQLSYISEHGHLKLINQKTSEIPLFIDIPDDFHVFHL